MSLSLRNVFESWRAKPNSGSRLRRDKEAGTDLTETISLECARAPYGVRSALEGVACTEKDAGVVEREGCHAVVP